VIVVVRWGKLFKRVLLDRALNLSVPVETSIGHVFLDPERQMAHGFDRNQTSHAVSLVDMSAKYADIVSAQEVLDWMKAN